MCNTSCAFRFDNTNGESTESGDVFRAVAGAYAATIFIVVPIDDIVTAILNTPVTAVGVKKALGVGLFRGSAGDAVGDFTGLFSGLFFCGLPLYDKSLSNVGKVDIVIKFGCGPDFTGFDSSMVRGC